MGDQITQSELANSIPEIWAAKSLEYLPKYLGLLNTVTLDMGFDEIQKYGDTINISKNGLFTARTKTPGSNVTLQKPSDGTLAVVLNNHKEITFSPEDVARAMAKPNVIDELSRQAAVVLAEAVEAQVAGLYTGAGASINALGLTGTNLKAKYYEARRRLIMGKVPQNEPLFGYESAFLIEDLLQTDVMQSAAKIGTTRPLTDGAVGRFAGFDHFETQAVITSGSPNVYHNLLYAKTGIVFVPRALPNDAESFGGAKQGRVTDPRNGLSVRVTMSYNANALAPQITFDCLWGSAVLRPEHIIDFRTN
jgi:hypothetical protein